MAELWKFFMLDRIGEGFNGSFPNIKC